MGMACVWWCVVWCGCAVGGWVWWGGVGWVGCVCWWCVWVGWVCGGGLGVVGGGGLGGVCVLVVCVGGVGCSQMVANGHAGCRFTTPALQAPSPAPAV